MHLIKRSIPRAVSNHYQSAKEDTLGCSDWGKTYVMGIISTFSLRHSFLIVLLFCVSLPATLFAQQKVELRGVVRSSGEPLPRASVVMMSVSDSTLISFAYTNDRGEYLLSVSAVADTILLSARFLGYKTRTIRLSLKSTHVADLELEEDSRTLKEVIVKAPVVWGKRDTINYSVARLAKAGDRTIGDVIRHIPGIRMEGDRIEYQGKPLKQINIEGIDLTQGNYGIITHNVDADDIASIQVLDNHQSIRALEGKRSSDEVVMNLRLVSHKRGILGKSVDLGAGYSNQPETNSRMRINYFARKIQILGVSYLDNSGRADFEGSESGNRTKVSDDGVLFSTVQRPTVPPLPTSAYLDNFTSSTSLNSAFVLADSSRLYVQGSYRYDKIASEGLMTSAYSLRDGRFTLLNEHTTHLLRLHGLDGAVSYEKNENNYYLKDRLHITFLRSGTTGTTLLNAKGYNQEQNLSNFRLDNQVHLLSTKANVPIEAIMTQQVGRTNEHFVTDDGALASLALPKTKRGTLSQVGHLLTVYSDNRIQIPHIRLVKQWRYRPVATLSYLHQRLDNEVGNLSGDAHDNILRIGTVQTLTYVRQNTSFEIQMPILFQIRRTSSDINSAFLFEPQAMLKVTLGDRWDIGLTSRWDYSEPTISSWYPHTTLRNYRSVTFGTPQLFRDRVFRVTALVNYRDIFSFVSSSLRVNYSAIHKPFIRALRLTDIGMSYDLYHHPHNTRTFMGQWTTSKGFVWWSLGLELDLGYTLNQGIVFYQGMTSLIRNHLASFRLGIKASPIKPLLIDYNAFYGRSRSRMINVAEERDEMLNQTMKVGVTLSRNLFWDVTLEHNYIHSNEENTHATLLGSEITWSLKRVRLAWEMTNLLNVRSYHTIRRLTYATIQESYLLRPRALLLKVTFKI